MPDKHATRTNLGTGCSKSLAKGHIIVHLGNRQGLPRGCCLLFCLLRFCCSSVRIFLRCFTLRCSNSLSSIQKPSSHQNTRNSTKGYMLP